MPTILVGTTAKDDDGGAAQRGGPVVGYAVAYYSTSRAQLPLLLLLAFGETCESLVLARLAHLSSDL